MLNHRNAILLCSLLMFLAMVIDLRGDLHWAWYLLPPGLLAGLEFYGAAFINSQFHVKTYCSGPESANAVALTFDDGPGVETEKVLDVLREHRVKAAFFCIGKKIQEHPAILNRISDEGHELGNHSYSHSFWFDLKNEQQISDEIVRTGELIRQQTHSETQLFRPPYGVTTPAIGRACRKLGLKVIGWNLRSLDTSIRDRRKLLTRIKKKLRPGSILLLHDSIPGTHLVVEELIRHLHENKYKILPLDKILNLHA